MKLNFAINFTFFQLPFNFYNPFTSCSSETIWYKFSKKKKSSLNLLPFPSQSKLFLVFHNWKIFFDVWKLRTLKQLSFEAYIIAAHHKDKVSYIYISIYTAIMLAKAIKIKSWKNSSMNCEFFLSFSYLKGSNGNNLFCAGILCKSFEKIFGGFYTFLKEALMDFVE